jgi:hypothetical protein
MKARHAPGLGANPCSAQEGPDRMAESRTGIPGSSHVHGVCDNQCQAARKSLILNGEMSEWLKEHARNAIRATLTE